MRRILSGPLAGLLLALWATPAPALAATAASSEIFGPAPAEEPAGGDDMVIIDDEMEGEGDPPPAGEGEGEDGGEAPAGDDAGGEDLGLFGDEGGAKAGGPVEGVGKQDKDSEDRQIKADMGLINVVQRQRMLKKGRFELQPQFGITVNDPYVRHYTLGIDMNYWFHNRMAIGLFGTGFIGAKTPRYDNIRFQEGLLLTANKTLWNAALQFTYNPFYGKIAIFNRALLHWELSASIGGGATQTQVIPRYESLHEPFRTVTGGGVISFDGRMYVPKIDWLAINAGVRTWIYPDKLEPDRRGPDTGLGGTDDAALDDPDAAKDASDFQVAFNVTVFLGVSFFFPTSFEYSTPR
jgi:outer membrane beta-barrel protein